MDVKDKAARAKLLDITATMNKFNRRKITEDISLEGAARFSAQLLRLEVQADRLHGKLKNEPLPGGRGGHTFASAAPSLGGVLGTVGVAAAASGALGLLPAFAAAGVGVAAFGALAAPTLKGVSDGMAKIRADTDAYDRATTKAGKSTALAHIRQDWAALSPGQQAAVHGIQKLQSQFGALARQLAPDVLRVFNLGLKAAADLLPVLLPLARSVTGALAGLLRHFDGFARSPGFKTFVAQLARMSGPAVTAIGQAIGKIAAAVGKFLISVANPGALALFGGAVGALAAGLVGLGKGFKWVTDHVSPAVLHDVGAAILAIYAAVKLWAAAQAVLDLALNANPVGLIVVAVAALATAFVLAWKHSATFRDVIKEIGVVFLKIAERIIIGAKFITDAFLGMVGSIIHGAAAAFGWVPGIGGKLRGAAAAFDRFHKGVDNGFDKSLAVVRGWERGLNASKDTATLAAKAISGEFAAQGKAATRAKDDISGLTAAITANGKNSDQAKAARATLITDLGHAGVKAGTAKADVNAYSDAVAKNGKNSDQAKAARQRLIGDILAASKNSAQGSKDLSAYTDAVKNNGSKSDAARAARDRLIADLEKAGLSAKGAHALVDGLQTSINNMHGKSVTVTVVGRGSGQIVLHETAQGVTGKPISGGLSFMAGGGAVRGGQAGRDSVLAALMPGELVVPTRMVQAGAVDHLRGKLPGFASGGFVAPEKALGRAVPFVASAGQAFMGQALTTIAGQAVATEKAKVAAAKAAAASAAGSPVPNVGSGVQRWKGTVDRALSMEGLSTGLDSRVLYQMQTESGGNPNAINLTDSNARAGDPSRGLMQVIMSTFRAYHWPGTSNNIYDPLANIAAAINYARHTYGPGLEAGGFGVGSGHGYAAGGLVPGYASGGTVGLRAELSRAQHAERAKYYGLTHAFATGPRKDVTRTVRDELNLLAKRQGAETRAYGHLSGAGLTTRNLRLFGSAARAESRTAGDAALNRKHGGHPLFAADLRHDLGVLAAIAAKGVPAAPKGTGTGKPPVNTAQLRADLAAAEAGERAKYYGLEHSFAIGPKKYLTAPVRKALTVLTAQQAVEVRAYTRLAGAGLTPANLTSFQGVAQAEKPAAAARVLSHMPGGHPLFARDLGTFLNSLTSLSGRGLKGGLTVLPAVKHVYGSDIADAVTGFLQSVASPFTGLDQKTGMALGGRVFDRGGTLAPGWNPPMFNGTGSPEHLVPARRPGGGAAAQTVVVQLEWTGRDAGDELTRWIKKNIKVRGGGDVQRAWGTH